MIEPAPPYRGEGPRALWHVSEDASIARFEPRGGDEKLVWAVDTRHLPPYWFPRHCPRATFWAHSGTSRGDVERFLGSDRSLRVHVVESEALDWMRTAAVVAYRLPAGGFEPWDRFWVARATVEPLEVVELGDLVALHEAAGIELRTEPELLRFWSDVVGSTLDFSGIRLRNATLAR